MRETLSAVGTPGGPEIDDDDIAFELREGEFFAVQLGQRKIRGGLAGGEGGGGAGGKEQQENGVCGFHVVHCAGGNLGVQADCRAATARACFNLESLSCPGSSTIHWYRSSCGSRGW